jgi:hypothetical protein
MSKNTGNSRTRTKQRLPVRELKRLRVRRPIKGTAPQHYCGNCGPGGGCAGL